MTAGVGDAVVRRAAQMAASIDADLDVVHALIPRAG
jgi:hypothetical protein